MIDPSMIALAERLANTAGDILRQAFRAPSPIERKSDASPVTEADRAVELAMRKLIEEQFPDHGIIGEEFGNVRPESDWQWVLDPIDGTRSFIAGYPLFTTLIALAKDGVPVLGIIDQPIACERWMGIAGKPTRFNSKDARTSGCTALPHAVIATTSTDYFTAPQAQQFASLKKQCGNTVLGGDAYAYAMLTIGRMDIVADAGMKPYDFCALKPIIEGAGGTVTDWQGVPVTIHSDGSIIASANRKLHEAALNALRP